MIPAFPICRIPDEGICIYGVSSTAESFVRAGSYSQFPGVKVGLIKRKTVGPKIPFAALHDCF